MYEYKAKLLRWIDGDTLLVEIDLGFYVKREERIRLARIDTPEMNSKITLRVRKARHARSVGKKFCPHGSWLKIKTHKNKRDMYARYIAEVFYNGENISDYLLKMKVGKEI